MRAWVALDNRLFRHDRQIVINTVRANVSGWRDLLSAGAALVLILVVARFWLGGQPWKIAAWAALGLSLFIGVGVGRLLDARVAFHSFDGLLAADAVQPSLRRNYIVAWHGIAIIIGAAVTLIARPSLIVISLPAYLGGTLLGPLASRLPVGPAAFCKIANARTVRSWLNRPSAGIVAALPLLVSLFLVRTLETKGVLAVIGMEAALFALMLTLVEQDVVRFKAISGYGPWRIVTDNAVGLLLFAGIVVPACWITIGSGPAAIVLVISATMLLLLAMRVLSYALYEKRFADLLVSMLGGVLVMVGYLMVVLLPFFIIAVLWQLQRRAAEKTWLLV